MPVRMMPVTTAKVINDLIMIVIRFLLYLDLMVIFGLPFFQIYGISGVRHETYNLTNFRSFIILLHCKGVITGNRVRI